MPKVNPAAKYRKLSVWSAKDNKRIGYTLTKADYADNEAVERHVSLIRRKQEALNKQYKMELKQQKIEELAKYHPIEVKINIGNDFNTIPILEDIDLKLDKNTGNSTAILGSGKQGKTTLMMYLYEKYYEPDKDYICTLFSINSHIKAYKKDSKLLRCNTFNDTSQKFIKLEKYINSKTKNKYKYLNMFDDVIDMKYTKLFNEMVLTYRNSNLSTIVCLQYVYLLSKMNRANVNNLIIFGSNSHESVIDLIKTFLKPYFNRMGITKEGPQIEFFKYITKDHGFFYIHNATDNISFHRIKV